MHPRCLHLLKSFRCFRYRMLGQANVKFQLSVLDFYAKTIMRHLPRTFFRNHTNNFDTRIANSSSTSKSDTRQSPRTKTSKIDTSATKVNTAYVWVLKGKNITKTEVKTGLNDNLHVQIISGLTTADLVITGVVNTVNGVSTTANGSPFLPTRGSQGKKSK